jgi:hypothetical protein
MRDRGPADEIAGYSAGRAGTASSAHESQSDGSWLYVIDNPDGSD